MKRYIYYIAGAICILNSYASWAKPLARELIPQQSNAPFLQCSPFHTFYQKHKDNIENAEDPSQHNFAGIINRGDYSLQLRLHLIRNAAKSIDIQTFIWANDECGTLVFHELLKAAQRGVKVRLIIDHIASLKDSKAIAYLTTASPNIEIKYYRPNARVLKSSIPEYSINAVLFAGGINQRMHNKMMLIDGVLAMTGGRNYDNHYYNLSTSYNFKDRDVMVIGPVVKQSQASFERFWEYKHAVSSTDLLDVVRKLKEHDLSDKSYFSQVAENDIFAETFSAAEDKTLIKERFIDTLFHSQFTRYIVDDPGKNNWPWLLKMYGGGKVTRELSFIIKQTEEELIIQTPYLIVNRWARRPFKKIRKDHPGVKFIMSTNSFAATDNRMAYSANYRLRSQYIKKLKFQIYEFMPYPESISEDFPQYTTMKAKAKTEGLSDPPLFCVHAKSFVMDGRIAFIGTPNLDPRSFNLNTEEGFLFDDEAIASALRANILRDTAPKNSWVIARRRQLSSEIENLNRQIEWISRTLPIDLWPLRYSTCYQLKEGETPTSPRDRENFYQRYEDLGLFPGMKADYSSDEFIFSIYKTFGKFMTPAM
jgi:cardiolipin synthase C